MTFKSSSVKALSDTEFEVSGEFTLLGKSKPLVVKVNKTGAREATAAFQIKRSEFGSFLLFSIEFIQAGLE
jgi:polyisoprenoid-binding protein YceI